MINLKRKGLPDCIYDAWGEPVFLDTDFRKWIDFPDRMEKAKGGDFMPYTELFLDTAPTPTDEIINQIQDFYYIKPEVPRDSGNSGPELLDYDIDADYIFAAFMQSYGIDLVETDLHWHKFLALITALPDDTTLSRIMGYRGYDGKSKDVGYKEYMKLKQMWELPVKRTEEEQEMIDEFNEMFG